MTARWLITVIACWGISAITSAQPAPIDSIDGVYNGSYAGEQGPTKFKLTLAHQNNGTLVGAFTLYPPGSDGTMSYTCDIMGRYLQASRQFQLRRSKWETAAPTSLSMMGMNGTFDPAGGQGAGQISGKMLGRPGPAFEAIRDAAESANLARVTAATKAAAPPPPVIAQQAPQPIAPKPASPPPSSSPVPAPAASGPSAINGVYTGEFKRANDTMKLKLSIKATDDGSLTALCTFDPPANHKGSSVTYKLTGKYVAGAKEYGVGSSPYQFTIIEPVGSAAREALAASKVSAVHVGITGPGTINGSITGSRPDSGEFIDGWITAKRDGAESADLDKVMVAQGSGTSTAVPVAPVVHPAFEGVYNGTATDKDGTNKFKLTLWLQQEVRTAAGQLVNTRVAGLLTVFATDISGTMPYTTEVKGTYGGANGTLALTRSGRWDPPPSGVSIANGVRGKFDPGRGGNAPRITGYFDQPSSPQIEATRDATESASMDLDRLRNHIYPGTVGVFNGTYTRENGPPTKFKLTVQHNGETAEVVGLATIYLPTDSGTKAYTYDLKGLAIDHGNFQLRVHDWVTPPPADFKNFKAMGFNGKVVLNEALTTATISSVPPPPSMAEFYMPQFEATWDATESADINGAIAAQKAVGSAEQAVALKARDEMMKNAPPKQLASKDLVRKSRQYWDGYQTDMIREVFDGGFGAAMDEDKVFQKVFCTYVELFSAKFPDCLPPNHVRVTNMVRTNRRFDEQTGLLISEENHDYTVDMDPRFVDKYKLCWALLNSKGEELRNVFAIAQPGGAQRVLFDLMAVGKGMQKFFADFGGKSAAMRQLNENFLRAINGEPSLQQAGGKIAGAQAESDPNLPPGRYARFVDGANAYFIERAQANPTKFGHSASHDTALCQRLAELYEFHMSRDEDYYYANDFAGRFVPIMGQRASCPDPAWPQLHPDVEKAIAEIK